MTTAAQVPGVTFTLTPRQNDPSPLRSDVAGLAGRASRGPFGVPVRVEGWRSFLEQFGGLTAKTELPYAVRGYFENGGEVAWIVRLDGALSSGFAATTANSLITIGSVDALGAFTADSPGAFSFAKFAVEATSPGEWANGAEVSLRYRRTGASGRPEVDVVVTADREPVEYLTGLPPEEIDVALASASRLIRLRPVGEPVLVDRSQPVTGPSRGAWTTSLKGGTDPQASRVSYLDAVDAMGREPEIALFAFPDLYSDVTDADEQTEILERAADVADALHDRLVVADVPPRHGDAVAAAAWADSLRLILDVRARSTAAYHPRLRVPDPLGGAARPVRCVPSSGHVAGVISRLDRDRGAHHTPANAPIDEAVDLARTFEPEQHAILNERGINLLRCQPGKGLLVWGGRTLSLDDTGKYIAHRRLIHRLVRAIRRVAEPLVFDVNGPELWLSLVRSITTVLVEAWRAGALKGDRPEDAFRVKCDSTTNPPESIESGIVLCEIEVAPAVPMEFILLRVAVGTDGTLEVFES